MARRIVGVIPARYASQRLPGKPLADLAGKPMVQRVYEQARQAAVLADLCVATDDPRIAQAVTGFGGRVALTRPDHRTGTDRLLEVVERYPEATHFVNIQGDEPFLHPVQLSELCGLFTGDGTAPEIVTLVRASTDAVAFQRPSVVKVVRGADGRALYFSRAAIPFARNEGPVRWWHHVGLYGYSRAALAAIRMLPAGELEQTEQLEQLRWLAAGLPILTGETAYESFSIDTPEDLARARRRLS